jgi:hypothetical protein
LIDMLEAVNTKVEKMKRRKSEEVI